MCVEGALAGGQLRPHDTLERAVRSTGAQPLDNCDALLAFNDDLEPERPVDHLHAFGMSAG